jgi:3-dehydroquinate dehydratase-1
MQETRPINVKGQPLGGGALPAVITPLVGGNRAEVLDEMAAIVPKRPDLIEWRIDFFQAIGDVAAVIDTALAIRAAASGVPVLLTRRKASEGGQALAIGEAEVLAMYRAACEAKCVELIDYELSNRPKDIAALREVSKDAGIGMILSFHDFRATPDAAALDGKFAAAAALGADVGKVAVMPANERDVLELLAATSRARESLAIPLISMAMGGVGSLSRIVGWVYGSAATFAVGKSSSAPGQIAIEDLRAALLITRRAVLGG